MSRRVNAMIETAMFIPLFVVLLVGTAEVGRVTYTYYSAQKALYNIARMAATRQGANLCDAGDPELVTIKNWALTGNSEGGEALIRGLTPDLVQVRVERLDGESLGECDCSLEGCDVGQGGRAADFVVVSVPDGFNVTVTIPYLLQQVITFQPSVRVPGGVT